jgi:signal peptidase II
MVVLLDQLSKLYVNTAFIYGARMPVWPGFDLTLIYNRGAAFSFLASAPGWQRGFFTLVGIGAVLLLTGLLYYKAHAHPRFMLALALIMGGALGNVMDRLAYGHVVDFLLFYWRDWYYPAFNLADISITCGAILLLWQEWVRLR